ncbi:MAG: hypothetical protein ABJC63_15595, partial [Gemmatimonadales bacterium]
MNTVPNEIPARLEDVSTPEAIINAVYELISGNAGVQRDWSRLKTLYLPDARLIPFEGDSDGHAVPNVMNIDQFIETRSRFFENESFFEWETDSRMYVCGSMAHVWSSYEAGGTLHGPLIRRGV